MAALSGIGTAIERRVVDLARNMLGEAGVANASKLTGDKLRNAFKEQGLRMVFSDETWPEEMSRLGLRYMPDYDYWGSSAQITDPQMLATATDVMKHNQRTILGLKDNPELVNVLGRPLATDEAVARAWYPAKSQEMVDRSGLPLETLAAMRGRLSGNTAFDPETRALVRIIEQPSRMYDEGNVNTEAAIKAIIDKPDYVNDPYAWSGQGEHMKTYNYAMNYALPLDPRFVTTDSHMISLSSGLPKSVGISPDTIFKSPKQYEMWTRATKEIADEFGMRPSEAQSLLWVLWRDLMSGDLSSLPISRDLKPSAAILKAIEGNPTQLLRAAQKSATSREADMIAAASTLKNPAKRVAETERYKAQGARRRKELGEIASERGVKLDPRLLALAALAVGGGGLGMALGSSGAERAAYDQIAGEA